MRLGSARAGCYPSILSAYAAPERNHRAKSSGGYALAPRRVDDRPVVVWICVSLIVIRERPMTDLGSMRVTHVRIRRADSLQD